MNSATGEWRQQCRQNSDFAERGARLLRESFANKPVSLVVTAYYTAVLSWRWKHVPNPGSLGLKTGAFYLSFPLVSVFCQIFSVGDCLCIVHYIGLEEARTSSAPQS